MVLFVLLGVAESSEATGGVKEVSVMLTSATLSGECCGGVGRLVLEVGPTGLANFRFVGLFCPLCRWGLGAVLASSELKAGRLVIGICGREPDWLSLSGDSCG